MPPTIQSDLRGLTRNDHDHDHKLAIAIRLFRFRRVTRGWGLSIVVSVGGGIHFCVWPGGYCTCVLYYSINAAVYSLVAHYLNDIVMILAAKTQAPRHFAVVVIGWRILSLTRLGQKPELSLRLCQISDFLAWFSKTVALSLVVTVCVQSDRPL